MTKRSFVPTLVFRLVPSCCSSSTACNARSSMGLGRQSFHAKVRKSEPFSATLRGIATFVMDQRVQFVATATFPRVSLPFRPVPGSTSRLIGLDHERGPSEDTVDVRQMWTGHGGHRGRTKMDFSSKDGLTIRKTLQLESSKTMDSVDKVEKKKLRDKLKARKAELQAKLNKLNASKAAAAAADRTDSKQPAKKASKKQKLHNEIRFGKSTLEFSSLRF